MLITCFWPEALREQRTLNRAIRRLTLIRLRIISSKCSDLIRPSIAFDPLVYSKSFDIIHHKGSKIEVLLL